MRLTTITLITVVANEAPEVEIKAVAKVVAIAVVPPTVPSMVVDSNKVEEDINPSSLQEAASHPIILDVTTPRSWVNSMLISLPKSASLEQPQRYANSTTRWDIPVHNVLNVQLCICHH